jgi:alpha-tubulin suppressor-like RCC1 family protein
VHENVAEWVLDIFSKLLGLDLEAEKAAYAPPKKPTGKPLIGDKTERSVKKSAKEPPLAVNVTTNSKKSAPPGKTAPVVRFSADYHTVAITRDGFVKAAGLNEDGQCNTITYDWRDMKAVSAGAHFTVGLRADGTLVSTGRNDFGQRNFLGWREIVAVSAGVRHTAALRADGTVLSTGQNKHGECNVRHWRNIVKVIAGNACTFGIKKDGRVLVSGQNAKGDLQVSHLNGVTDIAYGGPGRAIALLSDGRIARVGQENHMRRSFTLYKNVKQITAAPDYFAGLMENGTVKLLAYFWADSGTEAAAVEWSGVSAIAAGRYHILGLKNNRLFGAMLHPDITKDRGQLNVTQWEM